MNDVGSLLIIIVLSFVCHRHFYFTLPHIFGLANPLADKLLISAAMIVMVSQQLIYSWIAFAIIEREIIMI